MTASEQAKAAGLPTLATVSSMTGVSTQTLNNWHKHKQKLFALLLLGCVQQRKQQGLQEWNYGNR